MAGLQYRVGSEEGGEEGGQWVGMLKGIGNDQKRKYLLLCLQAWPPQGFVTGNLCQV